MRRLVLLSNHHKSVIVFVGAALCCLATGHSRVELAGPLFAETLKRIRAGRRHSDPPVLVLAIAHLAPAHRLQAARLLAAQPRALPAHLLQQLVAFVRLGEPAVAGEAGGR